MRYLTMAGAAALAMACGMAGQASAAEPVWSFTYADVKRATGCGPSGPCPATLQTVYSGYDIEFNGTSHASAYGGPNFGMSWASAESTTPVGGGFALAELKAYTDANIVVGQGFGWNTAAAQAVTGFKNTSSSDLIIPFDAFVGLADFTAVGDPGAGFVIGGLALTTDAIIGNDQIGQQWFNYGATTAFSASCATPGAIAIANGGRTPATLTGTATFAATGCAGSALTLAPGEEFYLWAKLTVFRAGQGVTDASQTFNVAFNPIYEGTALEQQLASGLQQIESANVGVAVPEPSTWAMMIAGFGGIGAMMRRRKAALA